MNSNTSKTIFNDLLPDSETRNVLHSSLAMFETMRKAPVKSHPRILDVGGGLGLNAAFFRYHGYSVDVIDLKQGETANAEKLTYEGDYRDFSPANKYDIIWSSHMIEHILNPGEFFEKCKLWLREGGVLAITVPPLRLSELRLVHPGQFNAGMILLQLIYAGFLCYDASVCEYGYNLSVIITKHSRENQAIADCLPKNLNATYRNNVPMFDGNINLLNWVTLCLPDKYVIKTDFVSALDFLQSSQPDQLPDGPLYIL